MKLTWNGLRIKPQQNIAVAAATLIGSIIGAAVSAIGSGINTGLQFSTNKQNQKNLETAWSRDDAQLQRARADATAAGFSPLAALSNNLTNTSPGMLQAPQFDSSGIVSSIQQGSSDYANYKSQEPILEQEKESMKLANKEKRIDLGTRRLQNLANLAKTMKELDGMDLSNYEKASILVASGIPSTTAQSMLKNTTKKEVVTNLSAETMSNLQKAQTELFTQQKSESSAKTTLTNAEAAYNAFMKESSKAEHDFWYEPLTRDYQQYEFEYPYDIDKDGNIKYAKIIAKDKNRMQIYQEYEARVNEFTTNKLTPAQMDFDKKMAIWNNINSSVGAVFGAVGTVGKLVTGAKY